MKFYAISENYLYQKAYKSGDRRGSRSLTVFVLKDKSAARLARENPLKLPLNRVGISVSKKVGDAVHRNRAKRVIREAYRQIDKLYGIKKGYLVVICPRTECTVLKEGAVEKDLLYCLSSLKMLCREKDRFAPSNIPSPAGDEDNVLSAEAEDTAEPTASTAESPEESV